MQYEILENKLTPYEFQTLRMDVGWGPMDPKLAELSLKGSELTVSAVVDGRIVGMARLVGDGGYYHYIQDCCVLSQYQGNGIGHAMVRHMLDWLKAHIPEHSSVMVGVLSERQNERFYQDFKFRARPNEFEGAGMVRFVTR